MLTMYVTLVCFNYPAIIGLLLKIQYSGITIDLSAARTSTFSQSLSKISRLNIAIIRMLDSTNQPLGITHGPCVFDLLRCQEVDFHTDSLSYTSVVAILVHSILG